MDEMKCPSCGKEVKETYNVCPHCGRDLRKDTFETVGDDQPWDDNALPWGILGFFIPIVGLILYLVWKSERPIAAHGAGVGALISVIVQAVVVGFLFTVAFFSGPAF